MKRSSTFLVFVTLTAGLTVAFGATPKRISYQGNLTDPSGGLIPDGPHIMRFVIYDSPIGGTILWDAGSQSVTTENGMFSYDLGLNVALPDDLFNDTSRYLGITVNTDPEMTPRTRLNSVPYSFQSLRADTASVATYAEDAGALNGLPSTSFATASHAHDLEYVKTGGGVMQGALGFENNVSPMINIYESGTTNPEKTVIAHSPTFPDWGLKYLDLTDEFVFIGTDSTAIFDLNGVSDQSVRLKQGAINALEMFDEPGLSSGKHIGVSIPTSFPKAITCSTTVVAPTDGFVFVIATAELWVDNGNPGPAGGWIQIFLDTTSTGTSSTDTYLWAINTGPTGGYFSRASLTAAYSVSAGNTYNYYLRAVRCPCSFAQVNRSRISAMFFPTTYGAVSSSVEP